jgi:hypothetical protein
MTRSFRRIIISPSAAATEVAKKAASCGGAAATPLQVKRGTPAE